MEDVKNKAPREEETEGGSVGYENKMIRVPRESAEAFDILKVRQGPRSGPRLAAEMIDLLLLHYKQEPVGPLRPVGRSSGKPKPQRGPGS